MSRSGVRIVLPSGTAATVVRVSPRPAPYSLRRLDGRTWERTAPWLVTGLLALAFGYGVGGGTGFSYVLGVLGALLAVYALFVAVWTTEDGRELHESVLQAQAALGDLRATLGEAQAVLGNIKDTAERLSALDRSDRLRRVDEALFALSLPALQVPVPPGVVLPDRPLRAQEIWGGKAKLESALRFKGDVKLPACDELRLALNDVVLPLTKFGGRRPPTRAEYRELHQAAVREVNALMPRL